MLVIYFSASARDIVHPGQQVHGGAIESPAGQVEDLDSEDEED